MEKGCRCGERLRAKTGGWRSLAHTRWSGGMWAWGDAFTLLQYADLFATGVFFIIRMRTTRAYSTADFIGIRVMFLSLR